MKANGPKSNSDEFHKIQQITKQGKVNVQRRVNDYDILIFLLDKYVSFFSRKISRINFVFKIYATVVFDLEKQLS